MQSHQSETCHFDLNCNLNRLLKMSVHLKFKLIHYRIFYHRWSTFLLAILIIQIIPMIYILSKIQNKFNNAIKNVHYPKYNETEKLKIEIQKQCIQPPANLDNVILLPDVLEHEIKPKPDKSIYFIVTTCPSNGNVILNSR